MLTMNSQKHLLQQIMIIWNEKTIQRQHSFDWKYEDKTTMYPTMELEGKSQKRRLTIPETPCEEALEHSEIANTKNSFFVILTSVPKIKTTQPKSKQRFGPRIFMNLTKNQKMLVRKSKIYYSRSFHKRNGKGQ